jgi:uncharacterized membrane protein HdeD (DUF308 family)
MSTCAALPANGLKLFWWFFAVRGGFSLLFGGLLQLVVSLFGNLFFEPIMLVYLSLLLGFYISGSGILLGVASGFAAEHHLGLWKLLLADCIVAVAFGGYIGLSFLMTPHRFGLLAAIHALAIGSFQLALAIRLRHDRSSMSLMGTASILSAVAGYLFLTHMQQSATITTRWLSYFEILCTMVALPFAWRLYGRNAPTYDPVQRSEPPSNQNQESYEPSIHTA